MIILLDIDGVMVTSPPWRPTENLQDGFPSFKPKAVESLKRILDETKAEIVLTTTHRNRFTLSQWKKIFGNRNISISRINKIEEPEYYNATGPDRYSEIMQWFRSKTDEKFVILDDDKSLNGLPEYIKEHLVLIDPLVGLNDEAAEEAINILNGWGWNEGHLH